MTYCANCGSQVEGKFCAKCGAAVGVAPGAGPSAPPPGAVPPGPGPVPPAPASPGGLGMDENIAAALCYIPIVGLIFLLVEPYNKNRNIKFHAMQSLFYCIAWIAVGIVLGIFGGIFMPLGLWSVWLLLSRLVELALFVGWVIMAVKAYQGSRFLMPIIGPLAEKQAG
jgi:uncharacterized membrane protein